jgi:hypothetical protein
MIEECKHEWVWVNKYSDLEVLIIGKDEVEYVDVNLYRCRHCGEVKAEAD